MASETKFSNYLIESNYENSLQYMCIHKLTKLFKFSDTYSNKLTNKKLYFLYSWQDLNILFLKNRGKIQLGLEEDLLEKTSERIINSKNI